MILSKKLVKSVLQAKCFDKFVFNDIPIGGYMASIKSTLYHSGPPESIGQQLESETPVFTKKERKFHTLNTKTKYHLCFVRHGQSTWNRDNRFIGWTGEFQVM